MPVACRAPSPGSMRDRDLVRHRLRLVHARVSVKYPVYGVPLRPRARPAGAPFSAGWVRQVRAPGGYGIDGFLGAIGAISARIARDGARIRGAAGRSPAAGIMKAAPGVGGCTAPVPDSEIGGIGRSVRAAELCACPAPVPSVGPSGGTARYGPVTRRGGP